MRVGDQRPDGSDGPPVPTMLLVAAVALAVLVLAGCAGGGGAPPGASPTAGQGTTVGGPNPFHVWVAVFRTAADPSDLDRASRQLRERLGSAVVVAPEGCYGGLRRHGEIPPGDYVLAVTAASEEQLDQAVRRAGEDPMVSARVEDLCPD